MANSRLPKTATILNRAPVAGKAVTMIAPTHVLAAFTREDGVYELSSIYPVFRP